VTRSRGQLVVLAALALALALVPMTLAYLQLGYDEDVETTTVTDDSTRDVERTLQRALIDAAGDVPARYDWGSARTPRRRSVTVFSPPSSR